MRPVSLLLGWKNGVVLAMISLLLACAAGRGTLSEARTQATPSQGTDSLASVMENVDQPVQVISVPKPRYPKALRDSLFAARVVLQFVVDTKGRAEPNSSRVLLNTDTIHDDFVEAAKEAMLKAVFRPARHRGRLVRQLVQQPFTFSLSKNEGAPVAPTRSAELLQLVDSGRLVAAIGQLNLAPD